jgi:hypothetical protein
MCEKFDHRNKLCFDSACFTLTKRLPVLLDVKGPLELEVLVLVVVGEDGDGFVVAAEEHA